MDVKFIALFQLFLCAVHIVSALSWYSSDWYYLPFPNPGTPTGNNIDGSLANVFLTCFCGVLNVVSSVCILFWFFCFLFQKGGFKIKDTTYYFAMFFHLTLILLAISLWVTKILKVQCFCLLERVALLPWSTKIKMLVKFILRLFCFFSSFFRKALF